MNQYDALRLIASLLLIVMVILAGAWAIRRAGWLRAGQTQSIRVVGTQSLGSRAFVSVIEVEDARLVVGVTSNQISLLHTMPPSPAGTAATTTVAPASFAAALSGIVSRRKP